MDRADEYSAWSPHLSEVSLMCKAMPFIYQAQRFWFYISMPFIYQAHMLLTIAEGQWLALLPAYIIWEKAVWFYQSLSNNSKVD